jgi:phosphatidylserine/phosphatidylglycerophosphate/cardiolipin synthase-like enzyme
LNDEVNLAVFDPLIARRLTADFERDLAQSRQITYEEWRHTSRLRIYDRFESLLSKQE